MKHLEVLTNIDRAKLLHELRPQPIKDYLDYAKGLSGYLQAHQKELEPKWTNEMFSYQYWVSLALNVEKRIDRYGLQLCKSSRLFADQLFSDLSALFAADALLKFVEEPECKDAKFKHLAKGIFGSNIEEKVCINGFEKRFQELTQDAVNFIHQTVAATKKIVLEDTTDPNNPQSNSTMLRLPTAFETVSMQELEVIDENDIIIRGKVKRANQYKPTTIRLHFLDRQSALFIAECLAKKTAY